ncbi:restriction endonuclease subunit S [Leptospira mayottensis]|uniref:restriction endonuclease subunit S n=1 Tax=Leptospira mayottensis TaxID=1137606 RepID=UPI001C1FA15D|nr:restriction endonuclease subunit S [Leptospira mayottensis]
MPNNWALTNLKSICTITYGKGLNTKNLKEIGFPVYGANGIIGFTDEYLYENIMVLISCRGAYSGKINLSPPQSFVTNNSLIVIPISSELLNDRFLFYALQSANKSKLVTGSAQPQVTINNAVKLEIPLPPLAEQQRIVSKIEELFSELDKGIENLKTAQQQLKVYRQAVLKSAFEGKLSKDWREQHPDRIVSEVVEEKDSSLGELPDGWKWVRLGEVIEQPRYGTSKKCEYNGIGKAVLRIPNIAEGMVDNADLKYAKFDEDEILSYSLKEGDILTIRSNGSVDLVGKCAIITKRDTNYLFAGYLIRLRPVHKKINSYFLLHLLSSIGMRNQIESMAKSSSGVNNINSEEIKSLQFYMPTLLEQQVIVQEIESRLSVCDKLEETIQSSLKQAESLRQSILKKAFEGKLVAQDPNDEPASVLLERIRAEKESIFQKTNVISEKKVGSKLNPENGNRIQFPRFVPEISTTELHAGVIAMIIDAHEKQSKYLENLNHVKCEKISHMVEYHLGISLGRNPVKDAAGPDDYPHLKLVESRALKANYFGIQKQKLGYTYLSKHGLQKVIDRTSHALNAEDLQKIRNLIQDFMPLDKLRSEVVATLFAAWNNLLLEGKLPTDEEIVFEARENWTPEKLKIPKENFLKTLSWMRKKGYVPEGKGVIVSKSIKKMSAKKKRKTKA